MKSRMLIGFLVLVFASRVHRVIIDSDLYRTMTTKNLIRTVQKLRTQLVHGRRIQ